MLLVVGQRFAQVLDDARQHIQAHDVERAKGSGFRQAHRGPSEGVDFLDRIAVTLHDAQDVERDEGADAVGDEVGRVLGDHNTFAEDDVTEPRHGFDHLRQRVPGRDDGTRNTNVE